jgi:predicted nucleic acid-binding protein
MAGKINACLTAQVIYEFFAIITNPKRVESPMKVDQAVEACVDFWECRAIEKIHPTSNTLMDVMALAKEIKLYKGKIFDCVMAITARDNKVECIYTENVADFEKYKFIKVVNPLYSER